MSHVFKAKDVNLEKIEYSDMRAFGEHAKVVYLNYNSKPIVVQTPFMHAPYGLSCYDQGEKPKYSLNLSFRDLDTNPDVKDLHDFLKNVESKILDDCTKKSLEWFKKKTMSRDVSEALFSGSIKISTEKGEATGKYPPTFKVKVPYYDDGKFKVACYDELKQPVENPDLVKLITKGQRMRAIVKMTGIWFAAGNFGITWDLVQLQLAQGELLKQCAFVDDDEPDVTDRTDDKKEETVGFISDDDDM